jgi:hypothetical protein
VRIFIFSSLTSPFDRFLGYYDDVSSRVDNNNRFASFFAKGGSKLLCFFAKKYSIITTITILQKLNFLEFCEVIVATWRLIQGSKAHPEAVDVCPGAMKGL